jgi:hypothetical protein
MTRLILHIGTAKTGTSTLQATFKSQGRALARAGILYPIPKFGKDNHNYLSTLLHEPDKMPREFTSGSHLDHDSLRAKGREFWEDIVRQVRRADVETAVLSGEYFFGLEPSKVETLRSMLGEVFSDTQVVAYVRHPATYYTSMMQQRVKASYEIRPPSAFNMRAKVCLSRYLDAFDGNVSVRSYHREHLVQGCVVRDFVASFLPDGQDLAASIDVVDVNESMSAEATCILQALRRYGWPTSNDVFAPESSHVMQVLDSIRERSPQTRAVLKPNVRRAITDKHGPDLAWLEATFGISFPPAAGSSSGADEARAEGDWTSGELIELLDVDRAQVEETLYCLVKELACRALRR